MRISDWSSDVCSSDLAVLQVERRERLAIDVAADDQLIKALRQANHLQLEIVLIGPEPGYRTVRDRLADDRGRSEEHTSELQSLMRISYAVFCLKKKKQNKILQNNFLLAHKQISDNTSNTQQTIPKTTAKKSRHTH